MSERACTIRLTRMYSPPTIEALEDLLSRHINAFAEWLNFPDECFERANAVRRSARPEARALIERTWRKLKQDLSGTLALVGSGHIGPAVAMTRVCREATLWMLIWAFSDPAEDVKN